MSKTHTIHLTPEDEVYVEESLSRGVGDLDAVIRDALQAKREADDGAELDAVLEPMLDHAEADIARGDYRDFKGREDLCAYLTSAT